MNLSVVVGGFATWRLAPLRWCAPRCVGAIVLMSGLGLLLAGQSQLQAQESVVTTLTEQLLAEGLESLAVAAREDGNVARGSVVFRLPEIGCQRCHPLDGQSQGVGPDLTEWPKQPTLEALIESILVPSKTQREGFESVNVQTIEGSVLTGRLVRQTDTEIVLRDVDPTKDAIHLSMDDVEDWSRGEVSLMPTGLADVVGDRRSFLDLVAFLDEVARGGPEVAKALVPERGAVTLPAYEASIDHAGLIRGWNDESYARGEAIYSRVCANCHGTLEQVGSLPTSLRFGSGEFKHGSDPYRMYQTLTHGFGRMLPQTWMVPSQKYDVIHYIRQAYLREHNPTQYVDVTAEYLAQLPEGDEFGPEPSALEPWVLMDYGDLLTMSLEVGKTGNFAYKGSVVRLDSGPGGVSRGSQWAVFDHDTLRWAAAWSGESPIDWNAILFNGRHGIHPRIVDRPLTTAAEGPGWANPANLSWEDPRFLGRDDKAYGPLPREWCQYLGRYRYGRQAIFHYRVGETLVWEQAGRWTGDGVTAWGRIMNLGARPQELRCRLGEGPRPQVVADIQTQLIQEGDEWVLVFAAGEESGKVTVAFADGPVDGLAISTMDLSGFLEGGPSIWSEKLTTTIGVHDKSEVFVSEVLTLPDANPWNARVRPTGIEFAPDGDSAWVCTWDGDVWLVTGLGNEAGGELTWQRIAEGLFQPLGIKLVGDRLFVGCRDQIVQLHDLNGDGAIDFYQTFNQDHQVTDHFHEFAMGLQADDEGNLYYAKSARHALRPLVPHHGTLLKVSADGSQTEIVASGFRAANGVCLNPDGTFWVTDQEGHWTPKNRINLVRPGGFYGNMWSYHASDSTADDAMEMPLAWITNAYDRSPAELVWVTPERWGPLHGALLNLSYGYGRLYVVLRDQVEGQYQGGMCRLPIPDFPTGTIRGRFHPQDGRLYVAGMFAWAGNQQQPGGLYRIDYRGGELSSAVGMQATTKGLRLTFAQPLDADVVTETGRYQIEVWDLKRGPNYGSEHHNQRRLEVAEVALSEDGCSVELTLPDLKPTWGMSIRYDLRSAQGTAMPGEIHGSIYSIPE